MITKFQLFENVHIGIPKNIDVSIYPYSDDVPSVGDYVICRYETNKVYQILGQIKNINGREFRVEFLDMPDELRNLFNKAKQYGPSKSNKIHHSFFAREILFWSKYKEDLDILLAADKYNL